MMGGYIPGDGTALGRIAVDECVIGPDASCRRRDPEHAAAVRQRETNDLLRRERFWRCPSVDGGEGEADE
jgi:hypothetical protein